MSGVPFFYRSGMTFLIPSLLLVTIIFVSIGRQIHKFLIFYLLIFMFIQFGQMIKFNYLPLNTYLGLYIRVLFAYFVIQIIGSRFISYYINIIVFLAVVSFLFYLLCYFPGIESFLITQVAPRLETPFIEKDAVYIYWPSIIIYTINPAGGILPRNSGPFWEPGAYGGFLIIALIFKIMIEKRIWDWKGVVLIVTLVSTFSTTAYLAFFFLLLVYNIVNKEKTYKIILVPTLLLISFIGVTQIEFLGNKISDHMDVESKTYNTRFKSALLDLNDFIDNPIFGLGRSAFTRFRGIEDSHLMHRNNGITSFLTTYGIVIFLFYFYLIYYSLNKICIHTGFNNRFAVYSLIIIFVLGFSEIYFIRPFFYGLTLLHLVYPSE